MATTAAAAVMVALMFSIRISLTCSKPFALALATVSTTINEIDRESLAIRFRAEQNLNAFFTDDNDNDSDSRNDNDGNTCVCDFSFRSFAV